MKTIWIAVFMFAFAFMISIALAVSLFRIDAQIHELKQAIEGPKMAPNWTNGHLSVAVVKHSPNCSCLK